MRKIKIIVSDFHLGYGRVTAGGAVNDLEDFVSDRAFVDLLEYYRTGEYLDSEVEVVLNGDIFECLATVDVQGPQPDCISAARSLEKISRIIDGHHAMFQALRAFAASDRRCVTLVVGNHDQDLLWEEVQALLCERIHPSLRFINDWYRFDGVHLEHGHQHELHNWIDPKRMFLTKGLPEPILNLPWGSDMFVNCLLKLKHIRPYVTRVRPLRLLMQWSLLHDFRTTMRGLWYLVVALVRARFRRQRERRIGWLKTLSVLFGSGNDPTLDRAARRVLKTPGIHTVVFGHTHLPMWRQLMPGKTYVNSGSWIPTSNLHASVLGSRLLQTFVYVEYESGVPRARLKLWHGRRLVEEDIVL